MEDMLPTCRLDSNITTIIRARRRADLEGKSLANGLGGTSGGTCGQAAPGITKPIRGDTKGPQRDVLHDWAEFLDKNDGWTSPCICMRKVVLMGAAK